MYHILCFDRKKEAPMLKTAFVTGGTGFVGKHLVSALLNKGYHVIAVSRSARPDENSADGLRYVAADTTLPGKWQDELTEVDLVVNLAGVSIFHYWTAAYKRAIHDSRILTTRHIVDALPSDRDVTVCSTSSLGYYGTRGDDVLTEAEPVGDDFLAEVCRDWESEALRAEEKKARVIIARFSTVMDKSGGAMKVMIPPYRFFVGGPMGSGKQWFPWIHLVDLIDGILFLAENGESRGIYNFCAPDPIRNVEMARAIGKLLHRPALLKIPGFAIGLLMGEFGKSIIGSQRGTPDRLLKEGFSFKYPDFKSAMKEVLSIQ